MLHLKSPDLLDIFIEGLIRTVVTIQCNSKSKMAILVSGRVILDIFSRTSAYEVTKLPRNVPVGVLMKCCYFSEQF